jgi:hypothetical protein
MTDDVDPGRQFFDGPVIRRPFGGLVVRLVDRFGVGSVSWSR